MQTDTLISDYLKHLEEAAARLPARRRLELVDEVREHIEAAIAARGDPSEAEIRNILERLGRPEEIVAAEAETDAALPAMGGEPAKRSRFGLVEVAALMLVTIGAFALPVIGPAAGIGLTWISSAWSPRQKALVTGLAILFVVLPIVMLMNVSSGPLHIESSIGPVQP